MRTDDGLVQVQVRVAQNELARARSALAALGGTVTGIGASGRLLQAFVPPRVLAQLADHPTVESVTRPTRLYRTVGSVNTEGDAQLDGPTWRGAGFSGDGMRIGVIDMGFAGYPSLLGSDLPPSVTVKNFVDGESDAQVDGSGVHGTANAEIIHDVAPGAQLFLAKVETMIDVEEAAQWLYGQGVKVISMSLGTQNVGPGDGTGWFEDIVAAYRAAGVTWFVAAGNQRQEHWGGASNIDVYDFHVFNPSTGQNVNYFGPGDGNAYFIPGGYLFDVYVRWNDWTAPVDQDFDIYLVRWNGSGWDLMAELGTQLGGADVQDGSSGQWPTETATGLTSGAATVYGFVVHRWSATTNVQFEMFTPGLDLDRQVFARSLSGLADANSVLSVGAVHHSTLAHAPYSGQGPTNGPGGARAGGSVKPDFAGYTSVSTVSYGAGAYAGTSAATPHLAGAAALALHANPSFTPDQLFSFLADTAVDLGNAGKDSRFGHGRVHLGSPPSASDTTPPTVTAPDVDFRDGFTIVKRKLPLHVAFSADDVSGIAATALQQKVNDGSFNAVSLPSGTAMAKNVAFVANGAARQFRAQATDGAANTSAWSTADVFRLRAFQDGSSATTAMGTWKRAASTKFYGGSVRFSGQAGARQSISVMGSDVAIVSTRGPNRGIAKVFVDGVEMATIDLYAPTTQFRRVVWSHDFGTSGAHTVELRVTGTKNPASSKQRVDFDAFALMGP